MVIFIYLSLNHPVSIKKKKKITFSKSLFQIILNSKVSLAKTFTIHKRLKMVKRNKNSNIGDLESISKADSASPGRDCVREQTQLSRHNITATTEERGEIVRSIQTWSDSQHGLQSATSTSRNLTSKRHKWTSEEYQEILKCYFITTEIYSNYPVTKKNLRNMGKKKSPLN